MTMGCMTAPLMAAVNMTVAISVSGPATGPISSRLRRFTTFTGR